MHNNHNNRLREQQQKRIEAKEYLKQLDTCREYIQNTCPEQWKFILAHVKKHCRLKKKALDTPDAELARLYYHKREMTQLYSELGGFYEEVED